MQLLGNLFEYALRGERARAQHPRRDVGRHRLLRRVRDARQARRRGVHAVAAAADERVPAGADVLARRPEHPQPRDRGHVRRLPGHRQGGQRRSPNSRRAIRSARSTRSTGRASPRRSSTTSRAISPRRRRNAERRRLRRAVGQFRQRLRRPRRARDGPADPPAHRRHQRERRARRVLPHRRATGRARRAETHATSSPSMDISKASNFERFVFDLAGRDPERLRDAVAAPRAQRRVRPRGDAVLAGASHARASCRAAARTPTASRPSATSTRRHGASSIRTPPTASTSAARGAIRPWPLIAIETALPAKFAATIRSRRSATQPPPPAGYEDLEARPMHVTRMRADVARVRDYIAAHAIEADDAARDPPRVAARWAGTWPRGCGSRCSCPSSAPRFGFRRRSSYSW